MSETLREYMTDVAKSYRMLKEFYALENQRFNRVVTEMDADHACKVNCGGDWEYDRRLEACINKNYREVNKLITMEGTNFSFDDGAINVRTMQTALRGHWGTDITSDAKIDNQADNAMTSYGTPAVTDNYSMQGGYLNQDAKHHTSEKKRTFKVMA